MRRSPPTTTGTPSCDGGSLFNLPHSTRMGEITLPCELPLLYSTERCAQYARVADAVLDQVFDAYEQHLANPTLDARTWKLVKTREDVQIHYLRERNPPSALHKPLPRDIASPEVLAQSDWSPMVKLRMWGTTLGKVDDAMYGACSPTDMTALMRSISNQDDFYHHKTLRHIRLPTVEEPFTYVGLKWNCRSSYLGSLIKARDMVLIESTGFREMMINGKAERVGYTMYHSVDLPEVTPLQSQDIIRAKYSAVVLYRQLSARVVDLFSTTSLQPSGDLMFKVTAFQAAEALSAVTKLTETAMKKKLVWMQSARAYGEPNVTSAYMVPRGRSFRQSLSGNSHKATCEQCARELKVLSSTSKCEVCSTHVCSRCITSHKLMFGYSIEELDYRSVPICKGCITTALSMDTSKALAVYEFVQPFDRIRGKFEKAPSQPTKKAKRRFSSSQTSTVLTDLSLDGLSLSSSRDERSNTHTDEVDAVYEAMPSAKETPTATPTPTRFEDEMMQERMRLWKQINSLCVQAEETYRLAVRQTSAIQYSMDDSEDDVVHSHRF